jgi:hypothetical protein
VTFAARLLEQKAVHKKQSNHHCTTATCFDVLDHNSMADTAPLSLRAPAACTCGLASSSVHTCDHQGSSRWGCKTTSHLQAPICTPSTSGMPVSAIPGKKPRQRSSLNSGALRRANNAVLISGSCSICCALLSCSSVFGGNVGWCVSSVCSWNIHGCCWRSLRGCRGC